MFPILPEWLGYPLQLLIFYALPIEVILAGVIV